MHFNFIDIFSIFMVLFAIIDIPGNIPVIIDIKSKSGDINSIQVTLVSLVIFLLAMEMVLGIELFKHQDTQGASIVPIAFPLIAGAGSLTTLLSLKAQYATENIVVALILNMVVVFFALKATTIFEKILGKTGVHILRKVFGIILLAIAIKLFTSNTGIQLHH